jgi:hypothetical protein
MATMRIAVAVLLALLIAARRQGRSGTPWRPTAMHELPGQTEIDRRTGAVRSTQAIALLLPRAALGPITSPLGVE